LGFCLILLNPLRQFDIRVCDFLSQIVALTQELHTGNKPSGDSVLVVEKNARFRIALETSHPRLDCPNGINSAALKESELIRVRSWDHCHVTAGLSDLESLRFQPRPAGNVLRVAELRGGNFFSANIL